MSAHHYVDETKAKGYVVVAARCPDRTMREVRRALGRLALPGQRSVHMKHESPVVAARSPTASPGCEATA